MSVWREVQETLYQRFKAAWVDDDDAPLTPIHFENEDGFDTPGGPWVRMTVRRMPGGPGTIGKPGNRKMDRVGRVLIQIFEPPGNGIGSLSDLGEQAAKIFENCRILAPHDIRFAEVEPGEAGDASSEGRGRWMGLPVEGRFDYEELT